MRVSKTRALSLSLPPERGSSGISIHKDKTGFGENSGLSPVRHQRLTSIYTVTFPVGGRLAPDLGF